MHYIGSSLRRSGTYRGFPLVVASILLAGLPKLSHSTRSARKHHSSENLLGAFTLTVARRSHHFTGERERPPLFRTLGPSISENGPGGGVSLRSPWRSFRQQQSSPRPRRQALDLRDRRRGHRISSAARSCKCCRGRPCRMRAGNNRYGEYKFSTVSPPSWHPDVVGRHLETLLPRRSLKRNQTECTGPY